MNRQGGFLVRSFYKAMDRPSCKVDPIILIGDIVLRLVFQIHLVRASDRLIC